MRAGEAPLGALDALLASVLGHGVGADDDGASASAAADVPSHPVGSAHHPLLLAQMDRVWHAALRTGLAGLAAPLADEHRRNVPGSVRAERLAQHIDRGVGDVGRSVSTLAGRTAIRSPDFT